MQKTNWLIILIITALTNIVSAAYEDKDASENKAIQNIDQSFYTVTPYDIVYGSDNASIEVLEYFSLTCSHCSYFYQSIFPELQKKYIDTGKVKWIKRLYVGDRAAMDGSLLLNCADKSIRKKYLNILLSKQSNWAFQQDPREILSNIANLGGISNKKFQSCMDDKKSEQEIKALTIKALEIAKIKGTPTFYINKEKLNIFSDQAFKDRFKEILSNKK